MTPRALSFFACASLLAALGPPLPTPSAAPSSDKDSLDAPRARTAGEGRDLLLRDFKPRSMLVVPEHEVGRAAFPSIDVHNHVNDAHEKGRAVPVADLLARMDRLNLKRIVILTGRWGQALQQVVDRMVKPHPDRFTVFTEPDWSRIDEPGFGEAMATQVRDAVARGARGLKVTKVLGLEVRDRTGQLVTVDDPRLDPMWAECGRLGIPVAIHTSDPDAFFEPVDATNERWEELREYPEWSFHGPRFPRKRALLDARNRVFARHPGTTFIALHVANHPEDLGEVSGVLDGHPNVVVETGARQAELGRQPRRAREFFVKYQDRILFGTDFTPEEGMYRSWFRFLETADEYFDYWNAPTQGRWKISGLDLPREVLQKVYAKNAERVFSRPPALLLPAQPVAQEVEAKGPDRQRRGGQNAVEVVEGGRGDIDEEGADVPPLRRTQADGRQLDLAELGPPAGALPGAHALEKKPGQARLHPVRKQGQPRGTGVHHEASDSAADREIDGQQG